MFYVASSSRSGSGSGSGDESPRIYLLHDALCLSPLNATSLSRAMSLQVRIRSSSITALNLYHRSIEHIQHVQLTLQACTHRMTMEGGDGGASFGQERHHAAQSALLFKLRQVALRSVQRLHEQQQMANNPPRMCGVLDWLVPISAPLLRLSGVKRNTRHHPSGCLLCFCFPAIVVSSSRTRRRSCSSRISCRATTE
jgi:hypothetical protein